MPMMLNGAQFENLAKIVCERYTHQALDQLARFKFNVELSVEITAEGNSFRDVVVAWIKWLEQRERTGEFLKAFRDDRQTVPDVVSFCDALIAAYGKTASPPQTGRSTQNEVRNNAIRFNTLFPERQEVFVYLNGYKELHDVLHTLKDMQEGIKEAIIKFRQNPENSYGLEKIIEEIEVLVKSAHRAKDKIEEPDDAADWIKAFEDAVVSLRSTVSVPQPPLTADQREYAIPDRALQTLMVLQNRQAELNQELVRCVKRLKTDQLVALMDGIIAGLRPETSPTQEASDLRAGLERFRTLCSMLKELAADHNSCQEVNTALYIVGPDTASPDNISFPWPALKAALLKIAEHCQPDHIPARTAETIDWAARTAKSVDLFEKASSRAKMTSEFYRLKDRFDALFMQIDKDLLKVTDELVREAMLLDTRLKRFIYE